jgi:hypothetical protein
VSVSLSGGGASVHSGIQDRPEHGGDRARSRTENARLLTFAPGSLARTGGKRADDRFRQDFAGMLGRFTGAGQPRPRSKVLIRKGEKPSPAVLRRPDRSVLIRGRALWNRRRRFLSAPCSNPGNTPDDRHAVQKERWLAGHNPNKSQAFPVKEPNGSRIPPVRPFLPGGKVCSALGSSNRVPERTSDRQR